METRQILRTLIIALILGSNVGCDQVSKRMVRKRIGAHEQIGFVHNYVTITRIENDGAFLSIGHTLPKPIKILILSIMPVLALGLALFLLLRKSTLSYPTIFGVCCIVGGGIGNIYDRIAYGSVTDFLHVDFGLFQTGIFNMADVSIMSGMFIVLGELFLRRKGSIASAVGQDD